MHEEDALHCDPLPLDCDATPLRPLFTVTGLLRSCLPHHFACTANTATNTQHIALGSLHIAVELKQDCSGHSIPLLALAAVAVSAAGCQSGAGSGGVWRQRRRPFGLIKSHVATWRHSDATAARSA